jgi:hypothetical protein
MGLFPSGKRCFQHFSEVCRENSCAAIIAWSGIAAYEDLITGTG